MNIFAKLKLAEQLSSAWGQIQKLSKSGAPVVKYVPVVLSVAVTLLSAVQAPSFVAHHVTLYAILNAAAQVLHSALPSTVVSPKP